MNKCLYLDSYLYVQRLIKLLKQNNISSIHFKFDQILWGSDGGEIRVDQILLGSDTHKIRVDQTISRRAVGGRRAVKSGRKLLGIERCSNQIRWLSGRLRHRRRRKQNKDKMNGNRRTEMNENNYLIK